MMARTHLAFGFLISLFLIGIFHPSNILLFVFVLLFASIFPDVDNIKSKIGRKTKIIGLLFKHRGIFHSVFLLFLFPLLIYLFSGKIYAIAFFFGYLSHLIADAFTPKGIAPFNPIFSIKIRGPIKTGKLFDKILFFVIALLSIYKLFTL